MDKEKAILQATQFFRFWKFTWDNVSKDQKQFYSYVPNSDEIDARFTDLEESALKDALKNKNKVGEAETGRLLVTCIIHEDGPYFEYYISLC